MICPNCNIGIRFTESHSSPVFTVDHSTINQYGFVVVNGFCPECNGLIIILRHGKYWIHDYNDPDSMEMSEVLNEQIIFPKIKTVKVEPEVPDNIKKEYSEAYSILQVSPRASAAMSRRLLQTILRDFFHITKKTLLEEIDEFLKISGIPSFLYKGIDAIRNVGNFAAHPIKNTQTGEIVDIEIGEAELLLDLLESLFDFAFIQPKRIENKILKLNEKLVSAGKPPMKI